MAQWLNWGDGSDGSPNAISGTVNTYATCTGTAGQTVLTTALAASDGDQILVHQTRHATAGGTWEIVKVVSDAGATLNLATALVNSYSTGAQAILIPQYTGGDISGAVTGTAWNGSVGGIIALMSNGDLTVSGSITAPAGFRGGVGATADNANAQQGESITGVGTNATTANGLGGGGGNNGQDGSSWQGGGGGGGGYATAGTAGTAGYENPGGSAGGTGGAAALTTILFGGGGGAAGSKGTAGKTGAVSGGIVLIIAKNITISGTIPVNGVNGLDYAGNSGGSGAGAGGSCLIKCQTAVLGTNKITASGGTGGAGGGGTGTGGNGGVGRIHIDYFSSYTGTTTPTINASQDLTLNVAGGSGFFNFF